MAKKADWVKRVAAWRASSQSARDFCSGRDYSVKSLMWWSWHLRRTVESAPMRHEPVQTRRPEVALARVVRRSARARAEDAAIVVHRPVRAAAAERTIIVHIGRARIEVAATDRCAMATVVDAVLASSAGERG